MKYRRNVNQKYSPKRRKKKVLQKGSRLQTREKEIEALIDKAHGPFIGPLDKNSPTPEIEAEIQKLLAQKGKVKYDKEYGLIVPSLTVEEARRFMPPRLQSLLDSYSSGRFVYLSKDLMRQDFEKKIDYCRRKIEQAQEKIREVEKNLNEIKSLEDIKKRGWLYESYEEFVNRSKAIIKDAKKDIQAYEEAIKHMEKTGRPLTDFSIQDGKLVIKHEGLTLEEAKRQGYIPVGKPFMGKLIWVQKPHDCGGYGYFFRPYHIKCSKCDAEVRLWEWGVDYDVG